MIASLIRNDIFTTASHGIVSYGRCCCCYLGNGGLRLTITEKLEMRCCSERDEVIGGGGGG